MEIDILSESELRENEEQSKSQLLSIPGVGEQLAELLMEHGFFSYEDIIELGAEPLMAIEGIGPKKAEMIEGEARRLHAEQLEQQQEEQAEEAATAESALKEEATPAS